MGEDTRQHQRVAGRIFKNFGFLTAGKLLGDVFTFLMFVILAREFGQQGIGEYSFAMALTSFLMIMADYGLTVLSIKEMSRIRGSVVKYYSEILTIRLIMVLLACCLLFIITSLLSLSERAWQVMILVGSFQIIYSVLEGVGSIFIAREKMLYKGLLEFSTKSSSALICIAVVYVGGGLAESLIVLPVIAVLHVIVAHVLVFKKIGKLQFGVTWKRLLAILHEARSYVGFDFLEQLAVRTDVVFIGFMLGVAAVGVYNVAYRVVFVLLFLPYLAAVALLPLASRLHKKSQQELEALYHSSLNIAVLIGLPIAAGIWLIAPVLIDVIFGKEFIESAQILRLLAVILFFACFSSVIGAFLTASDRQGERTRCQWTSAWVSVLGNLVLIPLLGIIGAAYATIFSTGLLALLLAHRMRATFGWPKISLRLRAAVLGALSFCVPLEMYAPLPLYASIPLAMFIYTAILVMFRDIRIKEGSMLLEFLKK